MKKYFLIFALLLFVYFRALAIVSGHYETDGKSCYISKSVMNESKNICNCPENSYVTIFGGIINCIADCSPFPTNENNIKLLPLPKNLSKEFISYLSKYRSFLESYNTKNSNELAKQITLFFESYYEQDKEKYRQAELNYAKIIDSTTKEEKEKINKWLKLNIYQPLNH